MLLFICCCWMWELDKILILLFLLSSTDYLYRLYFFIENIPWIKLVLNKVNPRRFRRPQSGDRHHHQQHQQHQQQRRINSASPQLTSSPNVFASPSHQGSEHGGVDEKRFAEYNGPSAYQKPTGKSNRRIMQNAISHCCLSGGVNRDAKEKCLQVALYLMCF